MRPPAGHSGRPTVDSGINPHSAKRTIQKAQAGTIMGVETNSMQFYPEASKPEAAVHPGLYRRRDGKVDLRSIRGPGFGYRLDEIDRTLPPPASEW